MKNFIKSNKFKILLSLLVILQPIIELDYLFYDIFSNFNLPRLTTIIRFIIIPLLVILGFIYYDKNKKRTIVITVSYIIILGLYFILHSSYANSIVNNLYLPASFYFSIIAEAIYLFTLVIPYFLIYLFSIVNIKEKLFKLTIILSSLVISVPIIISNLFIFGKGTYYPSINYNIFSWFTDVYSNNLPGSLASKFYFENGNSIGVLLFCILPILYLYYFKTNNKKDRNILVISIIIQSIAMFMISTRVTVYGAIITIIMVIIYAIISKYLTKNITFNNRIFIMPIILLLGLSLIFIRTPMYQNQLLAKNNDQAVKDDDYLLDRGKQEVLLMLENKDVKVSDELIKAFNKYAIEDNLISAIPPIYFNDYYSYKHDTYFWLDILFNVDFYDRANGRQVQELFLDYKMKELEVEGLLYGHGFSTFMNGALILEKDFVQQYNSLGIFGFVFTLLPWFILMIYGLIKIIFNFKKYFTMDTMILGSSLIYGFMGAYLSGNIIDQFITTTIFAYICARLLKIINEVDYEK